MNMRHLAVIGALWFLAAISASAQVQIGAQTARSNFLLYERVDLLISVTNTGDTDLVLNNNEGHPWLSFTVSHHTHNNYVPVHQEEETNFSPLNLKVGESRTLRV